MLFIGPFLVGCISTKVPPKQPSYADQFHNVDHTSVSISESVLDDVKTAAILELYSSTLPSNTDTPTNELKLEIAVKGYPFKLDYCTIGCSEYEAGYRLTLSETKKWDGMMLVDSVSRSSAPPTISFPFHKTAEQAGSQLKAFEEVLGRACGNVLKMFPETVPLKAISSKNEYVSKACLEWLDLGKGRRHSETDVKARWKIALAVVREPDFPPSAKVRASKYVAAHILSDEDDAMFKNWLHGNNPELQSVGAWLYKRDCWSGTTESKNICFAESLQVLFAVLNNLGPNAREAILRRLYRIKDYLKIRKFKSLPNYSESPKLTVLVNYSAAIERALSGLENDPDRDIRLFAVTNIIKDKRLLEEIWRNDNDEIVKDAAWVAIDSLKRRSVGNLEDFIRNKWGLDSKFTF